MTGRSVPEWVAESADTKIPPRVRLRVFDNAKGRCQGCTRKLRPGDGWQADHIQPLINGGANREANLQLLCDWCHKAKTAGDVAQKSKEYKKRLRDRGIKKPSRFSTSKESPYKQKVGGGLVWRATGEPVNPRDQR